jgi:hypothetical protein
MDLNEKLTCSHRFLQRYYQKLLGRNPFSFPCDDVTLRKMEEDGWLLTSVMGYDVLDTAFTTSAHLLLQLSLFVQPFLGLRTHDKH